MERVIKKKWYSRCLQISGSFIYGNRRRLAYCYEVWTNDNAL